MTSPIYKRGLWAGLSPRDVFFKTVPLAVSRVEGLQERGGFSVAAKEPEFAHP